MESLDYSNLEDIPKELQYKILLSLPAEQVLNICQTNRYFSSICYGSDFWIYRSNIEFGISRDDFNKTELSPSLRYLQLLSTVGNRCIPGSERFTNVDKCLENAAADNDIKSIDYFIKKLNNGHKKIKLNSIIIGSARGNNFDLLKDTIKLLDSPKYKADIDGLIKAGKYAIKNNNNDMLIYLLDIIYLAIHNKINIFYDKGSSDLQFEYEIALGPLLETAAEYNNISAIEYIKSLGVNNRSFFNHILEGAAKGNNLPLVEDAISKGANVYWLALEGAASRNNINLINYFINLMNGNNKYNDALRKASKKGNIKLLKYLINKMSQEGIILNRDYIDYIISDNVIGNFNEELIEYLVSMRPTVLFESINTASYRGDINIFKYIINISYRLNIPIEENFYDFLYTSLYQNNDDVSNYLIYLINEHELLPEIRDQIIDNIKSDITSGHFDKQLENIIKSGVRLNLISGDDIDEILSLAKDNNNYTATQKITKIKKNRYKI